MNPVSLDTIYKAHDTYYTHSGTDYELIQKAFLFAQQAHQKQKRASGEPYFNHVAQTALQLARWKLDACSIAAGLLHDTIEDCAIPPQTIQQEFGEEILFLIEGVTKLGKLQYQGKERSAESLRKMMLAVTRDLRVIFIKLADRLHNMRTLSHVSNNKQRRIALETAEIYAPIASRLGMQSLSGELEDLAFPYTHPDQYIWIQKNLRESYEKRTHYVSQVQQIVGEKLHHAHITPLTIDSRAKRISSLYKKLLHNDMDIERIYDLVAVRIIVHTIEECYLVLGVIHNLWRPLPGKVKDYIALPKLNGYQSLHTTVFCVDDKPTEFQIRTQEMHEQSEYGAAAHWFYETTKKSKQYRKNISQKAAEKESFIVKQLQEWQNQFPGSQEFAEALKLDLFSDRIFALTPKGEVIDLPIDATPIDFAYRIHTQIGDSCIGAKVNGKIVHLDYKLQSGDIVEILTQKNKKPSESWIHFVKTKYATRKIKDSIRKKTALPKKTEYKIVCENRIGMIKDVLAILSRNRIPIISVNTYENERFPIIKIIADIQDRKRGEQIFLKLRKVEGVRELNLRMVD
ncbi:MAG: RelA/SpoT family protein [Candidatus Paceibacterota bacterium]